MKLGLVLLATLAVFSPVLAKKGKGMKGLQHFGKDNMKAAMQMFQTPDALFEAGEECDKDAVKKCMRCVHGHAMICAVKSKTNPEHAAAIAACETSDPDFKDKDKNWQEKSGNWHKAVQECLTREDGVLPPVADSMLMMRKKRHNHEGHEGHSHGHGAGGMMGKMAMLKKGCNLPTYGHTEDEVKQCWSDMRTSKQGCDVEIQKCDSIALCMGQGDAPEDETDASWFNYVKTLGDEKKEAMFAHKKNVLVCRGKVEESATKEEVEAAMFGTSE